MGLDITAYRQVHEAEYDPEQSVCDTFRAYTYPEFADRLTPLKAEQGYAGEIVLEFRAGAYSGYNRWRDQLARLAGFKNADEVWRRYEKLKGSPFIELINFADNEGVIGSVAAAKLAKDFADWDERAKLFDSSDDWFYDRYQLWRKAFEAATDNGAVVFH
jgi:hypothetical protein